MDEDMVMGPGGPQPVAPDSSYLKELQYQRDQHPEFYQNAMEQLKALGVSPEQSDEPVEPPKTGIIDWFKKHIASDASALKRLNSYPQAVTNAIGRGVMKGVDALSNTVVGASVAISKKTGLYKVGRSPQEQQDFLDWWSQKTADANPLQFGEARRKAWLGPDASGAMGLVEGAAQFTTGMLTTGSIFKEAEGAGALVKVGTRLAQGAAVDMTAFDPYQERLADMLNKYPAMHPIVQFLAQKPDDSELTRRLKAAGEGAIVGLGMEGAGKLIARSFGAVKESFGALLSNRKAASLAHTIDAMHAKMLVDEGTISEEDGAKLVQQDLQAAQDALNTVHPDDHVDAVPTEEGDWSIVNFDALPEPKDGETISDFLKRTGGVPEDAPRFPTEAEADNYAAAARAPLQDAALPDPEEGAFNEELRGKFDAAVQRLTEQKEPITIEGLVRETPDINLKYLSAPKQIKAYIAAISEVLPDGVFGARGPVLTNREARAWAKKWNLANSDKEAGELLNGLRDLFGGVEGVAKKLTAYRYWMLKHAAKTHELLTIAEANPENAIAQQNYIHALSTLAEAHGLVAGTSSHLGQGLQSLQIKARVLKDAAKAATADVAGATEGASKGAAKDAAKAPKETWAGTGPNTETVLTKDEIKEAEDALAELQQARSERDRLNSSTDTDAVSAADFSLARARERARKIIAKAEAGPKQVDTAGDAISLDNASLRAEKTRLAADAQRTDPLQATPEQQAAAQAAGGVPSNPINDLSKQIDAEEAALAKALDRAKNPKPKVKQPVPLQYSDGVTYWLDGRTYDELRAIGRMAFLGDGDPAVQLAAIMTPKAFPKEAPFDAYLRNPVQRKRWWDHIISYRMEAMLSGPVTHVTNAVGNASVALQQPLEYWWAGMRTGDKRLQQQGADMLIGLWHAHKDAWSAAKKAFLAGDNVLDPGHSHADYGLKSWGESGWLSRILHAPSRMLLTSDEFFKNLGYRTHVRSQLLRMYREQGLDVTKMAERIGEDMKFAFDPAGGAINKAALDYGRLSTFTNELGEGTLGQRIQYLAQHPVGRIIMPFVRTPINIFRYAWERTPVLARVSKQFREDVAAGGERAAIAKAKVEVGTAVWSSMALLAASGRITGGGPTDPELRAQWRAAGNQPYSFKVPTPWGEKWVSYRRADPTLTAAGLAADTEQALVDAGGKFVSHVREHMAEHPASSALSLVADIVQASGELGKDDLGTLGYAFIASVARNVTSKTFMQGVADFLEAAYTGKAYSVGNLAENVAGSFVPNVLRQVDPDGTFRETRGMLDEIAARLPGFSATLEPRRNILGEKIMKPPFLLQRAFNPFTVSAVPKDGELQGELLKLGQAFSMPPETMVNGLINLTDRKKYPERHGQSPYDRMLELMSTGMDGKMPPLREKLSEIVNSEGYKKLPDGDKELTEGGMKYKLVAGIITAYQQAARAMVLNEYPSLKEDYITQTRKMAGALVAGGTDAGSSLQAVSQMFNPQK